MRALIFCPRNWKEEQDEWNERRSLCRKRSRELGLNHAVEAEDFPTLQRLCLREGYTHVIVPGVMHTPPEVTLWLKQQGIRVLDALRPASQPAASR